MTLTIILAAISYGLACFACGLFVARFVRHGTRPVYDAEFCEVSDADARTARLVDILA
jgi:hypothetical protein